MIASLRGTVIDKSLDSVVIECGGVGYECLATPHVIASLPRGEEAFVLTAHVVREDSQTLYAFSDPEQRRAFVVLQSVSGVGARLALAILSVLGPAELAQAVQAGDAKTLQKAPGVGKRLADRMAVDLKGKVAEFAPAPQTDATSKAGDNSASGSMHGDLFLREQVVEAMVGLGFAEPECATVVDHVLVHWPEDQPETVSAVLRAALSAMSGRAG